MRASYDRDGADPESRFGRQPGFSTSSFGQGASFQGEMSPEELFNMFFGGGGMNGFQGGFGGGGPSTFLFRQIQNLG